MIKKFGLFVLKLFVILTEIIINVINHQKNIFFLKGQI